MAICVMCNEHREPTEFYANDRKCKECRKEMVRQARADNIDNVRAYDRKRGQNEGRKAAVVARRPRYAHKQTDYNRKWREANPEKYKAHCTVNNAVRDGKLTKGDCYVCGNAEVEAHHPDYGKPLDVIWLCTKHHGYTRRIDDDPVVVTTHG